MILQYHSVAISQIKENNHSFYRAEVARKLLLITERPIIDITLAVSILKSVKQLCGKLSVPCIASGDVYCYIS